MPRQFKSKNLIVKIPTNIILLFFQSHTDYIFFFLSKNGKIRFSLKKHELMDCSVKNNLIVFQPRNILLYAYSKQLEYKLKEKHRVMLKSVYNTYFMIFNKLFFDLNNRFKVVLDLRGIGYRFVVLNSKVVFFYWGLAHPIKFVVPKNLLISSIDEKNKILVLESIDRHLVMSTAFLILRLSKFNIYTGKGICFLNQQKRTKIGKKAAVKK